MVKTRIKNSNTLLLKVSDVFVYFFLGVALQSAIKVSIERG